MASGTAAAAPGGKEGEPVALWEWALATGGAWPDLVSPADLVRAGDNNGSSAGVGGHATDGV